MILFSGSSNIQLAQEVAQVLGVSLGHAEVTRFIDNECRVRIIDEVHDKDVFVLQSLSSIADQHLVELCLFATALKNLGAQSVTAVIPWMGYSKQDKAFRKGEAISAQLVAKFIEAAGFDAVITVALHSEKVVPYFSIPIVELSTHQLLADQLLAVENKKDQLVVASPDKGGASRSELFAKYIGVPLVYLEKSRNHDTGEVSVSSISGDVKGKAVIIFDDIINTGATAAETSKFLKDKGATSIIFLATHAVFAGDAASLLSRSTLDRVVVTNTISVPKEKQFNSLTIISVASLLATAIKEEMK